MGKYALPCGILLVLVILGIIAYTQFEIYDRTEFVPPSHEALSNRYLALDRWLKGAGYKVRIENHGNPQLINSSPEGVVFVQASLFYWTDDAWEQLEPWVQAGGRLIISLDTSWYDEDSEGLDGIFSALGIGKDQNSGRYRQWNFDDSIPDFDSAVAFSLPESSPELFREMNIMEDDRGIIRLVQVKRGLGTVTVIGSPWFLMNDNLEREANAYLAWNLLAGTGETLPGILFIRGKRAVQGIFGHLVEQGNFPPLVISALVLIALGLWMTIPLFGVPIQDEEKPGRPLRERFLAESRFLKKYRALEGCLSAFVREIQRRLRRREGLDDEAALERRFAELWTETAPAGIPAPTISQIGMNSRELVKTVDTLETILERL